MAEPKKATKKATKKAPEPEEEVSVLDWVEDRPDVTESAWLYRTPDTANEHDRLKSQLQTAKKMMNEASTSNRTKRKGFVTQAQKALDEFEENLRVEGLAREFVFKGIGADAVDQLEWDHPPTEEQVERAKRFYASRNEPYQDPGVDLDGHSISLMAASLVSPEMNRQEIRALWHSNKISPRERSGLMNAARKAQGYKDDESQLADLVKALAGAV